MTDLQKNDRIRLIAAELAADARYAAAQYPEGSPMRDSLLRHAINVETLGVVLTTDG